MQQRLRVLFLTAWYPSAEHPAHALFVIEHAKAAFLYNDIVMLYAYADENMPPWSRHKVMEDVEQGIRMIRVSYGKYWGIFGHLKRLVFKRRDGGVRGELLPKGGRGPMGAIGAVLTIDKVLVGDLMYCWSVLMGLRRVMKGGWRPNVIHAQVFTAGVPAVILGRLYRMPVVITEHWTDIPRRLLTWDQRLKIRFAMKRARVVLPVSESLRQAIQAYGVRSKFRIVPNPVNTRLFSTVASRGSSEKGATKRMLSVTRLWPAKGTTYLLQAVRRVRELRGDFVLDIVGVGPDAEECALLVRKLGIDDIVRFHGAKKISEVAKYMQDCDFFVQASLVETFGIVYVEAMSCGKPVIACDIPGPNEFINDEVGILVPPGDVGSLANAIYFLLDHFGDYSPEKISEHVAWRFSSEVVGGMLDSIYREIAQL
jgi:glycosyltransferase involved in cell wall biosynthesis